LTNSAIIPLKLQKKLKIGRGQPKTVQAIYVRLARTAQKVIFATVDNEVVFFKFTRTDGTSGHY